MGKKEFAPSYNYSPSSNEVRADSQNMELEEECDAEAMVEF